MGIRYIGSKARIVDRIMELVGPPKGEGRFVDAFSGTGVVAAAAADMGWGVVVNDQLPSATAISQAALMSTVDAPFAKGGGYEAIIAQLNALEPAPGFIHDNYSPVSILDAGIERRYFTVENAAKIDAMRSCIANWRDSGHITEMENELLLADLIEAANTVANISGTYGCFLRNWTPQALKTIRLEPRTLRRHAVDFKSSTGDVFDLEVNAEDTVYLDPPYTKRQYSAYYHILETLYEGDRPEIGGVTGLRPWKDRASVFCYKRKALPALVELITNLNCHRVLLSYSVEGHVPQDQLIEGLSALGTVRIHEMSDIGRYRPNAKASAAGEKVAEYVIEVLRTTSEGKSNSTQIPVEVMA